jgi:hypothetical protein
MLGLIVPALSALLAALVLGGSLDHWSRLRVRWWPLALFALGVQVPLYSPPFDSWPVVVAAGPALGVVTTALILVLLVRNATGLTRAACLLAALGVALNLTVIIANGGWMPRFQPVAARLTADGYARVSNTAPVATETRLAWLGDSIEQPAWLPLANVVSPGDLLLSFGAAWWAFAATRPARRTLRPEGDA